MDDSILNTIKQLLGIDSDYDAFDKDIIVGINTAIFTLGQLGVILPGRYVQDSSDSWSDFLNASTDLEGVKTYIYLKTRIVFDPPTSSSVLEALTKQLNEVEWRLLVQVENGRALSAK